MNVAKKWANLDDESLFVVFSVKKILFFFVEKMIFKN